MLLFFFPAVDANMISSASEASPKLLVPDAPIDLPVMPDACFPKPCGVFGTCTSDLLGYKCACATCLCASELQVTDHCLLGECL